MSKKLLFIILVLICVGCTNNKVSDSVKFKREYEKYNNEYLKLDIDEDNIIKYSDVQEINKIISSGTGVIFVGNATFFKFVQFSKQPIPILSTLNPLISISSRLEHP